MEIEVKNNKLVIVLSRTYSTGLSIVRSLGAAGFVVDLIASVNNEGDSEITAASKYVRNHVEIVSGRNNELGRLRVFEELDKYRGLPEKPLLFPVDDYMAPFVDEHREELSKDFLMPNIDGGQDSILKYMDKSLQIELAEAAGMLVPKTWKINLGEEIVLQEDIPYPCYCKPAESHTGTKMEMAVCNSPEELKMHLVQLKLDNSNRWMLVQEYLNIDDEIDFSGVCLKDKVIIPAIIRKTCIARHEKGVTLAGRLHPFEELDEDLRAKIIATLESFKYCGMFDMELNIVGDRVYFNEVNLRSGGPNFSYFMSGVNLPALFVKDAYGIPHSAEEEQVEEYGKNFVYDKVAWEDYAHLFLSKSQLNKLLNSADFKLVENDDDPEPGKVFRRIIEERSEATRKAERNKQLRLALRPILGPVKRVIQHYPQTNPKNRRVPGGKPRVVIVSRSYIANLGMARALGYAGYETEVVRLYKKQPQLRDKMANLRPDAYSKYVKAYYIRAIGNKPMTLVQRLLEIADSSQKMLLVPADDLAAEIIDNNMDLLREYYLMPHVNNKQGGICRLMDKNYIKQEAAKFGIESVNSCMIRTENGVFSIPPTIKYPCFMKPNNSNNAPKKSIRRCDNEEELRAALEALSFNKDVEMLIEDYVEIDREYSILGLSAANEVIAPGLFVAEVGGREEHMGVALKGRVLPISDMQEIADKVVAFVKSLNYVGLFDVDLIQDREGRVYFAELNMRYGGSGYAITQSGANLPAMFANYMFNGTPIDKNCRVKETGKSFVSEKVVVDEYNMKRIDLSMLQDSMKNADIYFIKDDDDSKPYRYFRKNFPELKHL